MSVVASILIDVAAKVGAPMVKSILEKHVGGVAGSVGGAVIDAIAGQAGVSPQDLPKLPELQLEAAIGAVEASPEIILAYTRGQELSNELMLAEMNSESRFGWMWRPAGMWLMLFLTAWFAFLRPVVNAALWSAGTAIQIEIGLDLATFLGIFTIYTGLYMGGHTVMKAVAKAKGA
ncbi:3TM-type holin [Rhizobium sp. AAP43]|uniref:3TM-type holin n=1 Tax=Rhizobium sp. AAP43 TaxID=1523420 RepID=UPI0006B94474|nr:3TM-type holin [Rhizobium sp. AAP43]KPF47059.1 hypothetical protein IP76_01790 [Rhizobium sp. AAP43]